MEQLYSSFTVQNSNPRAEFITQQDIKDALRDIQSWISKNAPELDPMLQNSEPATRDQIQQLENKLKSLKHLGPTPSLQLILEYKNGFIPLLGNYRTLSITEILECIEKFKDQKFWERNYIPFARNDKNIICIEIDEDDITVEDNIITWCKDIGVIEELSETLGLYIEEFRDKLISQKFEYIPGKGLVGS